MILERLDVNECADRFAAKLHRNIYDFVLSRMSADQNVLEIGTGLGAFAKELAPRAGSYTGVEYDSAAAEETRRKLPGSAKVIQADARDLALDENVYSFIVCIEVLEHLGDYQAGLRGIHRCLNPDGMAIISVPYRRIGGRSASNPYHIYEPGQNELTSALKRLFKEIEVYYQYFEETLWMTISRTLHIRRWVGLDRPYADLASGDPGALSKLHISREPGGQKLGIIIVLTGKK